MQNDLVDLFLKNNLFKTTYLMQNRLLRSFIIKKNSLLKTTYLMQNHLL